MSVTDRQTKRMEGMRYKPNFFFKNRFVKQHETAQAKSLTAFLFLVLYFSCPSAHPKRHVAHF
jgi:hypothetical protein